ncbi:MAG: TA system VapC family ribonuclease toxin [Terracidiphilus sp.]
MTCLPDVNVWVALASDQHIHHALVKAWLESTANEPLAFCRITELGFLRLLTNKHVMGAEVCSPLQAWRAYDEVRMDARVIFLSERADFSEAWRRLGGQIAGGPNAWTDAYLTAFAAHTIAAVVTLDRKFAALGAASVQCLL